VFLAAAISAFAFGVASSTSLEGFGTNAHVPQTALVSALEMDDGIRRSAAFNHEPLAGSVRSRDLPLKSTASQLLAPEA